MVSTNIFAIKSLHSRPRKYSVPRVQLRLGVRSSLLLVEGGSQLQEQQTAPYPKTRISWSLAIIENDVLLYKNTKRKTPEMC